MVDELALRLHVEREKFVASENVLEDVIGNSFHAWWMSYYYTTLLAFVKW
jgi:hypothetical protein